MDGWAEYSIAVSSPQFFLRNTQLAASSVLHVINSERAPRACALSATNQSEHHDVDDIAERRYRHAKSVPRYRRMQKSATIS